MRKLILLSSFFASAAAWAQPKTVEPFPAELPPRPAPEAIADGPTSQEAAAPGRQPPAESLWHEREVVEARSGRLMVTIPADAGVITLTLPPGT